jgi:hypothetical protein
MKVVIIFTGLIAHLTSGPTWRTIAVEAPSHHVVLTTAEGALIGPCKAPACIEDKKAKTVRISLEDESFTLVGVKNPVFPRKSPMFDATVPSLMTVLQAPVDPEVLAGDVKHTGVSSSVDLVGGEVSPASCLLDAAQWEGEGDALPICLAAQTAWVGELVEDTLTLKGSRTSWTFHGGSRLEISNEQRGNHFKHYKDLSKTSPGARIPKPAASAICLLCTPIELGNIGRVLTPPDLECTPTRYP